MAEPMRFKTITDINRHGIRRERYAAGYASVAKMKKKEKKNAQEKEKKET